MRPRTVRKHAAFSQSAEQRGSKKTFFSVKKKKKKSITLRDAQRQPIRKQISCQRSPPSPSVPQRFFFPPPSSLGRHTLLHTHRHTYIPLSRRRRLGGWQRSGPVICQPPPVPEVTPGKDGTKSRSARGLKRVGLNWA